MNTAPRRMRRWLVALLALEILFYGGYWAQVEWARRVAAGRIRRADPDIGQWWERGDEGYARFLVEWKRTPIWGDWGPEGWVPRRVYYEQLRIQTGLDLPNDPGVWASSLGAEATGLTSEIRRWERFHDGLEADARSPGG